jgi:SP family facilitated glucose transporter-like MFS transporter 3
MATERDSLLKKGGKKSDEKMEFQPLASARPPTSGRPTLLSGSKGSNQKSISMAALTGAGDGLGSFARREEGVKGMKKAYSVSADGSPSYLTPLQMGRHELYELVPFTAVFGMQRKEKNLSQAFASYAADLDTMEADQIALSTSKRHLSSVEMEQRRSYASLMLLEELEMDAVMVTMPLIFAVFVAAMSQFLVGYNTGVMNAPSAVVFPGHSTGIWSLAVASFAVGGPFGAIVAGGLAETRGRRGALLINSWLFLIGGLVQTFALDMFTIILARFLIGFASGFASVLVPIYLGELAPPTLRGMLGTLTQFAMVIGILVSDLLAFPFATEDKWRYLFAVTAIVAALQILCAPFLLESPRWLLNRDPSSRKARYLIKKLRGLRYDHEVETEVGHFISASKVQQMDPVSETSNPREQASKGPFMELFTDKKVRMLVVSSLVLQMAQQLCGINAVFYYSTMFFEGVISNPLVGTTVVGAVNVVATYVALMLMDSCGRRTLILWSSGGMFICCIMIVLSLLGFFNHLVALFAVGGYVSFFEIGLGPIPWLIVAEMFDAKYVTIAMSACCQLNWACNFIVGLVFPYMNKYLGPYSFVPFAVVLLGTFIFALIWLPETQGTTPAELQAELAIKNSTSVVYHNINIEGAHNNPIDVEWRKAMEQLRCDEEKAMKSGTYSTCIHSQVHVYMFLVFGYNCFIH